jgi:hypothetical protein
MARIRVTTIIRLEAFDPRSVRGQTDTITVVVHTLAPTG